MIATVIIAMLRKREAASALGWCLAIVFVPFVGMLAFYVFGLTRVPRRLHKKRAHRRRFSERFDEKKSRGHGASDLTSDRQNLLDVTVLAEKLGAPAPTSGNVIDFYHDGEPAFDAIFDAVRRARESIHVFKYIFRDDGLGRRFLDLLTERASEGVEVRLIVDAIGTIKSWRLLQQLRKAGGRGVVFMPFFSFGKRFVPNLRNHRKLVIVDGREAFFGGLNVGDEYLGRRSRHRDWCDLHLQLRGPGVNDLQRVFAEDWDFAAGELLSGERYFPAIEPQGESLVQIVSGGPDQEINAIRQVIFAAITEAHQSLYIASPYVVPDAALRDALKTAAWLGVDVRILTQAPPPDHWIVWFAQTYYYDELLRAGVRIHEYTKGMMHSKALVADGALACVGTANLDNRSLFLNFELMGLLESSRDVKEVERRLLADIAASREVTLEAFSRRSSRQRILAGAARLVAPLL